ncbi:UNKNOWN [Stylonychia lemnae]|uniref:Uncharacterized protein n=1 Tax=Stylonychia lemnae TaxID=5949 RepID=A0A078ANZ5_STYLE|nr:UNKNOWN [Stylonychia lemnae]|eukprot:CDW83869.1 UNKNOWN [Stylonychia lemnae]
MSQSTNYLIDIRIEIEVKLPYTILLQKFDFHLDEQFCKEDFAKVFQFNKLLRKSVLDPNIIYQDALILSHNKASPFQYAPKSSNPSSLSSQIDIELEALRNEVLNCGASSLADDQNDSQGNKHSIKVCSVGTQFKLVMKVSDNFGFDLNSAKEHPNKELQEDLRSISRTMMQESESEVNQADEGKIQEIGNMNQITQQIGQLQRKNSETFQSEETLTNLKGGGSYAQTLSESNQLQTTAQSTGIPHQRRQSRNNKQKQHQSFLEKAINNDLPHSTKATYNENEEKKGEKSKSPAQTIEQQRNIEKIFKRAFSQIVIGLRFYAWPCFRIPQANNLIPLMNTSFLFNQYRMLDEKKDVDFMIALSMMSGRKFIQAAEQFRKLQNEILLNENLTQQALDRCIQFEILIADSMNQHSQLAEKINAFQRAVDLSLKQRPKQNNNIQTQQMHQIREEESYKLLMMMHPYLTKILLQNLDSKIEAIKVAVLRNLEFLIDQLGCSLDQYLVQILIGIIHTYPRSNLHFNNMVIQNQKLPIRYGFYQTFTQQSIIQAINSNGFFNVQQFGNFDLAIQNSYMDSIFYDQNQENDFQIKEGINFQQTYQTSIKNLHNHILESFIQLLSSMSSQVLQQIYNEILIKSIFLGNNPLENQLATDLRIYLLKLTDKIINICQGDLVLNLNFINNMVQTMIPDQRKLQNAILSNPYNQTISLQNQMEIAKAKQKTSETISLACHNLWQTCRQKLFCNYSAKGVKILLEWTFNNLITLAENSETLNADEQSKLTMVFDIIDLFTQQQSALQDQSKQIDQQADALEEQLRRQSDIKNQQINSLSGRETRILSSRLGEQNNMNFGIDLNSSMRGQPLIRIKSKSMLSLELYALINPILFWLDFSLEKLDRLSLFKMTWKTLLKILSVLPEKLIDIDEITVILPVLQKVNNFCQQSSPQLEMLQFLQIVFQDLLVSKKLTKELIKFLDIFLTTISKCIPHNLHEEVFVVCEQILEIMKNNLKDYHIRGVIDALTDKYTMRSKAHKRLQSYFIQMILEISCKKPQADLGLTQQNSLHASQQQDLIRQSMQGHLHSQTSNNFGLTNRQTNENPDHIDNYDYERDSNEYADEDDEQSEEQVIHINHIQHQRQQHHSNHQLLHHTNQDYNESPMSQRLFHSQSNFHQNSAQIINDQRNNNQMHRRLSSEMNNYFETLVEICLFTNQYEFQKKDKYQEQINLELYFEKLAILQLTLKSMSQTHIQIFCDLIKKSQFKDALLKVLKNERSPLIAIELLELYSTYYINYCTLKNIYDHQVNLLAPVNPQLVPETYNSRPNNNNQTSQSSGGQQQNHNYHRESSRGSFASNAHNNNLPPNFNINLRNNLGQNPLQMNTNYNIQINGANMAPSHQILRYQHIQNTEDDLLIENLNEDMIQEEIDIINRERLILIQLHAQFIRYCSEQYDLTHDAHMQFHTLNMIDNLFTNLMPVPNFQNLMIKQNLQRQRNQFSQIPGEAFRQQQIKIHHYEIPDLERFQVIENLQNYQQLLAQQQHLPPNQVQSIVYNEFESRDPRFLHARLNFGLKIWNFIEQALFQSSWSNIKSICYGVICQLFKVDIQDYKSYYKNKVKQVLFPLLNSLLFSKESESKAGGLNILGSFCGLGHDFTNINQFKINQNMAYFRRNSNFISLALWQQVFNLQEDWDPTIREASTVLIQVCAPRESVRHFNSIVHEKYQLKMQSLIKTYNVAGNQSLRQKIYQGAANSSIQTPSILINQSESVEEFKIGSDLMENLTDRSSHQEERRSIFRAYMPTNQSMRSGFGSQLGIQHQDRHNDGTMDDDFSSSGDERVGNFILQNDSNGDEYFYVDTYNEDQIKQIIAIFKNDYKPPKNLWIEKNGVQNTFNQNAIGSEYIDLNLQQSDQNQSNNIMDVFEDKIVDRLNNIILQKGEKSNKMANALDQYFKKQDGESTQNASGESEYLIFERHFESDKEKLAQSSQIILIDPKKDQNNNDANLNLDLYQEDLGIIDLDEDEGGDEFDELDDDKLPVLKNTYSKKNRPNNSKSVAIGSRTQEMQRKSSQLQEKQQESPSQTQKIDQQEEVKKSSPDQNMNHAYKQQIGLNFDSDEDEVLIAEDLGEDNQLSDEVQSPKVDDVQEQDQKIDEYEMKIAKTIQDLNDQLKQVKDLGSPKSKINTQEELQKIIQSPQIQITATKVSKRNEDLALLKSRPKTNKSFDLKQKKNGLSSPLRVKDYMTGATNITQVNEIDESSLNLITPQSSNNQKLIERQQMNTSHNQSQGSSQQHQQVKKINDPLANNSKKSYSSQAQRLKNQGKIIEFDCDLVINQGIMKKDASTYSKPQLLSNTSPGPINSLILNPQSAKQSNIPGNNLPRNPISQFQAMTTTNRKRKSDYHRKSDVPPYSTLAQKKFASSSMSQNPTSNQLQNTLHEKSIEKVSQLSHSQINNALDSSLMNSKNQKSTIGLQSQSLMQKAKQAFVSRAKSQSYLNSFMGMSNSNSVGSSVNLHRRADNNSFKQQSSTHALGINKSLTVSVEGGVPVVIHENNKIGNRVIDISLLEQQTLGGIRTQGPIIHQIHKGYFSNDDEHNYPDSEIMKAPQQVKRKLHSPPGSGDLQKKIKNSFSSDDEGKLKIRPQSHHLKTRKIKHQNLMIDSSQKQLKISNQVEILLDQDQDDFQDLNEEKNRPQKIKKSKRYIK